MAARQETFTVIAKQYINVHLMEFDQHSIILQFDLSFTASARWTQRGILVQWGEVEMCRPSLSISVVSVYEATLFFRMTMQRKKQHFG